MKKILKLGLGALALAMAWASPSVAAEGLSANAAVTSNYVFRGISQSGANPAVQAGLDYDLGAVGAPGFSIGSWASSINFGDDTPIEWDLYGGYTGALTDQLTWSINTIAYLYPNAPAGVNYNWYEFWFGLNYDFGLFSVSGRVYYAPDYVNLSNREFYYNGGISIPVAPWLSLNGAIGYTDLENDVFPLIKSYTDWTVSLSASFEAYTFTVGYTDTNLDGAYKVTSGPFQTNEQLFVMFSFRM